MVTPKNGSGLSSAVVRTEIVLAAGQRVTGSLSAVCMVKRALAFPWGATPIKVASVREGGRNVLRVRLGLAKVVRHLAGLREEAIFGLSVGMALISAGTSGKATSRRRPLCRLRPLSPLQTGRSARIRATSSLFVHFAS